MSPNLSSALAYQLCDKLLSFFESPLPVCELKTITHSSQVCCEDKEVKEQTTLAQNRYSLSCGCYISPSREQQEVRELMEGKGYSRNSEERS